MTHTCVDHSQERDAVVVVVVVVVVTRRGRRLLELV